MSNPGWRRLENTSADQGGAAAVADSVRVIPRSRRRRGILPNELVAGLATMIAREIPRFARDDRGEARDDRGEARDDSTLLSAGCRRGHRPPASSESSAKNASSWTSTLLRFVRRVAMDALPISPWSARYSH